PLVVDGASLLSHHPRLGDGPRCPFPFGHSTRRMVAFAAERPRREFEGGYVLMNSFVFEASAVIFDFDGVILESVKVKTDAFKELFSDYPEHLEAIVAYHENN